MSVPVFVRAKESVVCFDCKIAWSGRILFSLSITIAPIITLSQR